MRIYAAVIAVFMLASLTRAFADTSDADFFKHTWDNTNTELQMAKIATTRATSGDVKNFANKEWEGHNKMFNDLKQLGDTKHWDFGTFTDNKELFDRFNGFSGADFDRNYLNWVVEDHTREATNFEKAAREGTDNDLKAFAAKYLPDYQNCLKMAQDINGRLGKGAMAPGTETPANVSVDQGEGNLENRDLPAPMTPEHGEYGEGMIQPAPETNIDLQQPAPQAQNTLPPPPPQINVQPTPPVATRSDRFDRPSEEGMREFRDDRPINTSYGTTYSSDCGCGEVIKTSCDKCESSCKSCDLPCCATFEEFKYDNDYRAGTTHYVSERPVKTAFFDSDCGCEKAINTSCDSCGHKDKCDKCESSCKSCDLPCCATFEEFKYDNDYRAGETHYNVSRRHHDEW
ncbi:MAG TPA: DUF4142 domain-containing protein [Planctomycetota bacterium]|jgi:putative membrane protein